jgi:cell wall-associated NlpC family hydrolase
VARHRHACCGAIHQAVTDDSEDEIHPRHGRGIFRAATHRPYFLGRYGEREEKVVATKTVSGAAVAIMAVGGVAIWSGLNNVTFLDAVRSLAKGQAPTPNRKPAFQPLSAPGSTSGEPTGGSNSNIVNEAMKWKGTKYVYGGCHGCTPCHPGQGVDCSSYVTWVMRAVGCYSGKCSMVAGSSMLAWGKKISASDVQAGDVVLWVGKHCGIVTDPSKKMMIAAPHTGDVVKVYSYEFSLGVPKVFLRAPCSGANENSKTLG